MVRISGPAHEPTHPWPLPRGELGKRALTLTPLLRRGWGWVHGPDSRQKFGEVFASHEPTHPWPLPGGTRQARPDIDSPPPEGLGVGSCLRFTSDFWRCSLPITSESGTGILPVRS